MSTPGSTTPERAFSPPPVTAGSSPRSGIPLVRRLHFYAGVLVAPFILIAALTGALYAVAPTLERVVYRDVLIVDPGEQALPLTEQAAAAQAARPGLVMAGMRPAAGPEESTRVLFADPALGPDTQLAVFVDPYAGHVLGAEPVWFGHLPLSTWLDGLHRHLQLGEPGRLYSELAASWLWVVALGGLTLWWTRHRSERRRGERARLLTPSPGTGRSRTLNWHAAVGVWILPMLLFLSATGITWSTFAGATVSDIRAHFAWERPTLVTALGGSSADTPADDHADHAGHAGHAGPSPMPAAPVDVDGVVAAAASAGVRLPLELTLPAEPGEAVGVLEVDEPYRLTTNAAAVDPVTLRVTSSVDYANDYSTIAKLADWGIRMHMGFLFGWLNQLVLFVVAAGLVTVIVRGYRMWWQRRPTRASDRLVGRPPARGVLRRTHPGLVTVVVAAAIAVGWFLPLLGVSLVAFLVADVAIGRVQALRHR
jgi:uncharacterized iron-regulated membrane protein